MKLSQERYDKLSPLKKAFFKIEKYKEELKNLKEKAPVGDVAIIGMALKFPEANTPEEFWNNLIDKKDHIIPFPEKRKSLLQRYYKSIGKNIDTMSFQEGAYLKNIDHFDYDFFKFPSAVAATIHPLQRLYLETSWKAMEDAACLNASNKKAGIYFGASGDLTYSQYIDIVEHSEQNVAPVTLMGNTNAIASSRLSYFLDLKGPAVTVDTACSSSLIAIHQAYNALLMGDCEVAIAGGGKLHLLPEKGKYSIGFESPTGRTKPFDADSDGAGIGEGVAAIVMKPLQKAIADNDAIYAVIKGSSINQDGTSVGISAPNPEAQTEVILKAAEKAKIDIETITFIETHGTGTQLGDPIEFQALKDAFATTKKKNFCSLGAVKSNIGHLFEAAGIAGLIKCVLALQHETIPPSINHTKANINVDFKDSPFYLNTEIIPWKTTESPRRCAVSSFGISGTNAHVILEEYTSSIAAVSSTKKASLFILSAHSMEALEVLMTNYKSYLNTTLEDVHTIAYATNKKQGIYEYRFAVVVSSINDLKVALESPKEYISDTDDSYIIDNKLYRVSNGEEIEGATLTKIASEYLIGGTIDWTLLYKKESYKKVYIPSYPLVGSSCWPKYIFKRQSESNHIKEDEVEAPKKGIELTFEGVYGQLSKMIEIVTGISISKEMGDDNFLDIGIDSLILMEFIQAIKKEYNVNLEIGHFFELVSNLNKLSAYILEHGFKETSSVFVKKGSRKEKAVVDAIDYFVPYKKIGKTNSSQFNQEHLSSISKRIISQTKASKKLTQKFRGVLANNRNIAGFRPETKEITYQIIAKKAKGAIIEDIDGNEYVDLTMGFGVNLLGYNPDFIEEKLHEALKLGFPLGPISDNAGEVAQLISDLTGNERVAFYNSGSEAIMVALRLARTVTQRSKYVIFKAAYHGTFEGVLAIQNPLDPLNPIPLAPGISDNFIENTIVLDYGTKESLEFIEKHAHELAAILVEPVQSRRPDIQPTEFLRELRKITEKNEVALIFDEVITGFRIHPGGAQAYFGVKADICTYGKIVGGGMPIGVVAGTTTYLDAIDGGHWQFGDESSPVKATTFVAGTFNSHPLTMASSLQILTYLKEQGEELQLTLTKKTTTLVERLTTYFTAHRIPIKVFHFGSLFRFTMKGGWELFYQHLLANKVYVWEGRNCFLSTAHTDENIEFIYQAIVKSVTEILEFGAVKLELEPSSFNESTKILMSEDQEQMFVLASSDQSSSTFNENQIVDFHGDLNIDALEKAIHYVVNRHDVLKTVKIEDGAFYIAKETIPVLEHYDWETIKNAYKNGDTDSFLNKQGTIPFKLSQGPFVRFTLLKMNDTHHRFLMSTHLLVTDGHSIEIVWSELSRAYSSEINGKRLGLMPATSLKKFNQWIKKTGFDTENLNFWADEFKKEYPKIELPSNFKETSAVKKGDSASKSISSDLRDDISSFARAHKCTLFNVMLSTYNIMLNRLSGQHQFVLGIPTSGRLLMGDKSLVGQCVKMLPLYISIDQDEKIGDYLSTISTKVSRVMKHQQCSFHKLFEENLDLSFPKIATEMDMNSIRNDLKFEGLTTEFSFPEVSHVKYDLSVSIIEIEDGLTFSFYYNTGLFESETIAFWMDGFENLLKDMVANPTKKIKDLEMNDIKQVSVLSHWNTL